MIVNRAQLAEIFGVNVSTIDAWGRRGMPSTKKVGKGTPSEYDSAVCIEWRIDKRREEALPITPKAGETNAQELKRRRLEAETIIAELDQEKKLIELTEKKGKLVFIDDANAAIIDAVTTLRQRLLTIPRRLTPLVLGETDDRIVSDKIYLEIANALEDIARTFERESEAAKETTP